MEMSNLNGKIKLWWIKITKPFRKLVLRILLEDKKVEAKWKRRMTGVTQYVVVTSWHSVQVMDKTKYEFCRKFIRKKHGMDLRRNVMYRADGTLVRNPDYIPAVERMNK